MTNETPGYYYAYISLGHVYLAMGDLLTQRFSMFVPLSCIPTRTTKSSSWRFGSGLRESALNRNETNVF